MDYGVDVSVLPDGLDLSFGEISGARVLLEDAYKTLTTPSGVLWWDDDTLDIRGFLLDSSTSRDRGVLAARCKQVLETDPRLRSADVAVSFSANALTLRIRLTPIEGASFTFVLETDGITVDLRIERTAA